MRTARACRFSVLASVLLVALAACSGGDDSPAASPGPTEPADATTTTAPTFTGAGSDEFCTLARQANQRLGELAQAPPSEDAVRELFTSTADSVDAMADVAPAEIGPAARTMATAYAELVDALSRVQWQPDRLPAEAEQRLNAPEVTAAGNRLSSYQRQVCRFES